MQSCGADVAKGTPVVGRATGVAGGAQPAVGLVVGLPAVAAESSDRKELAKKPDAPEVEKDIAIHILQASDTMNGLVLRYGSTPEDICRANGMIQNDLDLLPLHCALRIPLTREAARRPPPASAASLALSEAAERRCKQQLAARAFAERHSTTVAEATYYLSDSDWNAVEAAKERDADLAWEKEAKKAGVLPPSASRKASKKR